MKTDIETEKILNELKQEGWDVQFEEGRYRSVEQNKYAVIPLQNNNNAAAEEAALLWLENIPTDENAPHVAGYRRIESDERPKYITTRVVEDEIIHTTPDVTEDDEQISTQDVIPGNGGGCGTCMKPQSRCPYLEQNWYCFVDIVGYALSVPAFFAGCAVCIGSLGWISLSCAACIGSILRGSPANLPCDDGFYTNCYVTGYYCVPEQWDRRACGSFP